MVTIVPVAAPRVHPVATPLPTKNDVLIVDWAKTALRAVNFLT